MFERVVFTALSVLFVLKVLRQLPEGLAIAVLAALEGNLDHHLSILPTSLHPLAIEAAFPSIRRDHSLTLDFDSLRDSTTTYEVLQAATTAPSYLQQLDLQHISMKHNDPLMQKIAEACMCASDVTLSFDFDKAQDVHTWQHAAQVREALSHNNSLTSLQLALSDVPSHCFNFDYLLDALTGLHSLSLARNPHVKDPSHEQLLPAPVCIVKQLSLSCLRLGPGFHLMNLPQILPHMTSLRALHLFGGRDPPLQELPPLSPLTALQTIDLKFLKRLKVLPPVATLTGLQTLNLKACVLLEQLPPLETLEALQTLSLSHCWSLLKLPALDSLTALQTLELRHCDDLQGIPSLASLTALHTLHISYCGQIQRIPFLETLTALQTLELCNLKLVQQIPPLATLTALQNLELDSFKKLHQVPSLACLTALQKLRISYCSQLKQIPSLATLTALQTVDLSCCKKLEQFPSLSTLTALQTLDLSCCKDLQQLPSLSTLTALRELVLSRCLRGLDPTPLGNLAALQKFRSKDCEHGSQLQS
jgi:Leucine-rich repeat (LRR) protein